MNTPFERTLRALDAERRRTPVAWIVGLVVLGAWVAWAVVADVRVHVGSTTARVEAREPVHVLRAEIGGRLVAARAELGERVDAADVIFELDPRADEIRRDEAQSRARAVEAERAAVEAAIAAALGARESGRDVLDAALHEAEAKLAQARGALQQANREVRRLASPALAGTVSVQDRERARAFAAERRAEVSAVQALADRLGAEEVRAGADRTTAIEQLRRERLRLDAAAAVAEADASAAEYALEQRRVRTPIAGRLGELPELRPGDVVQPGQALGAIIPDGDLRVVAHFPAERALGWIVAGAPARLRLDAFPWTWFGQVHVAVARTALDSRDGLLRVELDILDAAELPLRHGLSGSVEVEVERTTPLALLLRSAGQRGEPSGAGPAPASPGLAP